MRRIPAWCTAAIGSLLMAASAILILLLQVPADSRLERLRAVLRRADTSLEQSDAQSERGLSRYQHAMVMYRLGSLSSALSRKQVDAELASEVRVALMCLLSACHDVVPTETLTQYDAAVERAAQGDAAQMKHLLDELARLVERAGYYRGALIWARHGAQVAVWDAESRRARVGTTVAFLTILGLLLLFLRELPLWRKEP